MSGLKVVDDTTFTIQTSEPVSNLPVRLGYSAFAPLPDSFFADPKAFEKKPIGAGPFKMDSISNTEFVLSKFADYSGANQANVDKMTFRVYQDPGGGLRRRRGRQPRLHRRQQHPAGPARRRRVQGRLPGPDLAAGVAGSWAGSRSRPTIRSSKDNVELRKAISRAIDRDLIVKQIFNGTRTPATGWVSPVVDGYKADACGDACNFDAAAAKAAYDAAGGYEGTLTMTYNADAPQQGVVGGGLQLDQEHPRRRLRRGAHRRLRHLQQEDRRQASSRASSAPAGRRTTRRSRTT